jgi:hypothetical protein
MATVKIGLRDVRSLKPGQIVWDATVKGFGARRQQGDAVAYFLKYRTTDGRQRWMTFGRHGSPWTPDMARDRAKALWVKSSREATQAPRGSLSGGR